MKLIQLFTRYPKEVLARNSIAQLQEKLGYASKMVSRTSSEESKWHENLSTSRQSGLLYLRPSGPKYMYRNVPATKGQ